MANRQPDEIAVDPQSDHRVAQSAITAALVRALAKLWPMLNLGNLGKSRPAYEQAATALVQQYALAAMNVAAEFYEKDRQTAGVTSTFRVPMIAVPDAEHVSKVLDWALSDATPDADTDRPPTRIVSTIQSRIEGGLQKIVADTGRDLTMNAVEKDRAAVSWARVPKPGACWWCRMLGTRGAVYKTEETAHGESDEGYHDHCECEIRAQFKRGAYVPPAHVKADMALYNLVSGNPKLSSEAKRANFRRAVANQESANGAAATSKKVDAFTAMSVDDLKHQQQVLDGMPASEYKTAYGAKIADRLAELQHAAA